MIYNQIHLFASLIFHSNHEKSMETKTATLLLLSELDEKDVKQQASSFIMESIPSHYHSVDRLNSWILTTFPHAQKPFYIRRLYVTGTCSNKFKLAAQRRVSNIHIP